MPQEDELYTEMDVESGVKGLMMMVMMIERMG